MQLSPEIILAIATFISVSVGAFSTAYASHRSARKDDFDILRSENERLLKRVTDLQAAVDHIEQENSELRSELLRLQQENIMLRIAVDQLKGVLRDRGIELPPLPIPTASGTADDR
jgi:glutamine synthetase adenylyltransferase